MNTIITFTVTLLIFIAINWDTGTGGVGSRDHPPKIVNNKNYSYGTK